MAVFFSLVQFNSINNGNLQAVNDRAYYTEVSNYKQCLTRVQTRLELRGQFISLYDLIETSLTADNAGTKTLIDEARVQLDENYPALDPSQECPVPNPPPDIN